jgi:NAD(P)-dependent dehydrogenase (short-subunit alcohol dehydrogenase family)
VNNAGYGYMCPVEDTSLADFRAQIETNLFGVIIMTKAVLPYFRERRAGRIIQVTSIAGRIGSAGRAPYAAAKFGVEGLSESLSKEIGPLGVKVTIVEPGGRRVGIISPTIKTSGHEEASRPPVRSALGNAQGLTNPGFFANRNVWSAALSQAKNESDRIVCANVFGLRWSISSWP